MSTPKIVKQDPNSKDSSENNGRRKKGGFGSNSKDCQQFVIIGAVLGCALVASSLMMCFLSARLMRLTKQYKREKLGIVKPKNLLILTKKKDVWKNKKFSHNIPKHFFREIICSTYSK